MVLHETMKLQGPQRITAFFTHASSVTRAAQTRLQFVCTLPWRAYTRTRERAVRKRLRVKARVGFYLRETLGHQQVQTAAVTSVYTPTW